jgi:hypothetical protein
MNRWRPSQASETLFWRPRRDASRHVFAIGVRPPQIVARRLRWFRHGRASPIQRGRQHSSTSTGNCGAMRVFMVGRLAPAVLGSKQSHLKPRCVACFGGASGLPDINSRSPCGAWAGDENYFSNASHERENNYDDQDETKPAARIVTPSGTIRPGASRWPLSHDPKS